MKTHFEHFRYLLACHLIAAHQSVEFVTNKLCLLKTVFIRVIYAKPTSNKSLRLS